MCSSIGRSVPFPAVVPASFSIYARRMPNANLPKTSSLSLGGDKNRVLDIPNAVALRSFRLTDGPDVLESLGKGLMATRADGPGIPWGFPGPILCL